MRRAAYLIFAGITLVALSFAGFAVFAPVAVDAPEIPVQIDLPDGRGLAAGRLASMSFTAVASSVEIQSGGGSLMAASPVPGNRVEILEAATTTIPRSSSSSSSSSSTTTPPLLDNFDDHYRTTCDHNNTARDHDHHHGGGVDHDDGGPHNDDNDPPGHDDDHHHPPADRTFD
ncbi:MAG: hypothetical protein P1T08_00755 [Acidimicrobiia bacterium]|nr:hypothetical protein [Acidimicrobiia bacterium]